MDGENGLWRAFIGGLRWLAGSANQCTPKLDLASSGRLSVLPRHRADVRERNGFLYSRPFILRRRQEFQRIDAFCAAINSGDALMNVCM